MVFSSALFLFVFLPLTYILYKLVRSIKAKNFILIVSSLIFYSFGRLDWTLLLIVSVIFNYIAGLFMIKGDAARKISLIAAICVNLGILCTFKYLNFFTSTLDALPFVDMTPTNIALPIGVSFFTFQGMSYVIDVYRNPTLYAKKFDKVLLYIIFFPQLVAGPIVKYEDIANQIDLRDHSCELTVEGMKRFVVGLVKKLFFANTLGYVTDQVYALDMSNIGAGLAWLGVLCYTLQIYYDFSAYSDMAIGLGKMFGFYINENFNHPYCAKTVKEFWRRWHISLSTWFKNYLYIPLGGNRKGIMRARMNRLIVFFFTGMWHGANWTFILWGLWHGMFLLIEDTFLKKQKRTNILNRMYTLFVVLVGFMIFRAENVEQALLMAQALFTRFTQSQESVTTLFNLLTPQTIVTLLVGIVFSFPITARAKAFIKKRQMKVSTTLELLAVLVIFILCVIKLAASSFNPFIYTQF